MFTGTNITVSYDNGTDLLTLSGYDTIANYNMVMSAVGYFATGDNPTNYGNNTTRTRDLDGERRLAKRARRSGAEHRHLDIHHRGGQ